MDGPAVFKFAVRALDEVCRETLAANNMKGSDIDWLVPHQANIRIIQATADKLGLPRARVVTTVESQGNTSAASVPLALDAAIRDGRIHPRSDDRRVGTTCVSMCRLRLSHYQQKTKT